MALNMNNRIMAPVLLIAFNRPDTTLKVFEQIKKVCPPHLYIAVDGPRNDRPGEEENCKACQDIANLVDWECEVHTLFRKENVGCGLGPAGAISWAFETAEELIVLEDDCLPSLSFFYFCDELLTRYKADKRIWIISGLSIHSGHKLFGKYDYTFARLAHTWGWATWKDRWNEFDLYMKDVPQFLEEGGCYNVYQRKRMAKAIDMRLQQVFNTIEEEVSHSWDTQWSYTRIKNGSLNIVPKLNLITNIGVSNGTHVSEESASTNLKSNELNFPLKHPHFIVCNTSYDYFHYDDYINKSLDRKIKMYVEHPMKLLKAVVRKMKKLMLLKISK